MITIPVCAECDDFVVLCDDCKKSWAECGFTQCSPCATASGTNDPEDGSGRLISTHAPVTDELPHEIPLDEYLRQGYC